MTTVTIAIAVIAGVVIWFSRPVVGLVVFVGSICLYPQYLTIEIASIDFTTGRIVILILLLRLILKTPASEMLRIRLLDVLVLTAFAGSAFTHVLNDPISRVLAREGGGVFDTILPYFCARFALRSREDIHTFARGLVIIGAPLVAMGVYECVTGHNPYKFMREYSAFDLGIQDLDRRMGFFRADASFGNKIAFGLYFSMAIMLNLGAFGFDTRRRGGTVMAAGFLTLGLLSSLSSAPVFALVAGLAFMVSYPIRHIWPYLAGAMVAFFAGIELFSDRHFYEVLTRLAFDSKTAYYRIGLFEEAFGGGMDGHWLVGFGYVGVIQERGQGGFNWQHWDLTNIYIGILARTGLMGLISFLVLNVYYYWTLFRAFRGAATLRDKWLAWTIGAGLFGWNLAMMTVGALAQISTLLYVYIAVAGTVRMLFCDARLDEPEDVETPAAPTPAPKPFAGLASTVRRNPMGW